MTNFGCMEVVALLGAIVVYYYWGEGNDQLWRSGCGAIAGCHYSVLWLAAGVDVMLHSNGTQKKYPENQP